MDDVGCCGDGKGVGDLASQVGNDQFNADRSCGWGGVVISSAVNRHLVFSVITSDTEDDQSLRVTGGADGGELADCLGPV